MKTFSIFNNHFIFFKNGRVLKLNKFKRVYTEITKKHSGYQTITCRNGKELKTFYLHRLIYKAFNPELNINGLHIDHLNRNKSDNRIDNLKLTSHQENMLNRKFRKVIRI